jgi:hypothetical protein
MTIDVLPGFLTLRLGETSISLRDAILRPPFGRTLPIQQTCSPFAGSPEVDDFRHLNERQ